MNEPKTIFKQGCEVAFDEEHWQKINYSTGCYEQCFAKGKENYRKNRNMQEFFAGKWGWNIK